MKKNKLFLLTSLLLLASCSNNNASNVSSNTLSSSSSSSEKTQQTSSSSILNEDSSNKASDELSSIQEESSSSEKEINQVPFEDLYQQLGQGFQASITKTLTHSDGDDPDYYGLKVKLASEVIEVDVYSSSSKLDDIYNKTKKSYHIEKHEDYACQVGISITNSPLYTDIPSVDQITNEVFENMLWEDIKLDNVFNLINVSNFSTSDNKTYTLNMTNLSDEVKEMLARQMFPNFSTEYNSGSYVATFDDTEIESLSITINESTITSINVKCKDYVYNPGWGTPDTRATSITLLVENLGAQSASKLAKLEGTTIAKFDSKIATLASKNYEVELKTTYDDTWYGSGTSEHLKIKSYNGTSYQIDKLNTSDETKIDNQYIYYQASNNYLSLSFHDGIYYANSALISGNLSDLISSANVSSIFFTKDTTNSTSTKEIYTLNASLYSSSLQEHNVILNSNLYSGEDKYISDLQVIFENDTISFINTIGYYVQTFTFSNINKVEEFIPEYTTNSSLLHYDDLISLDTESKQTLLSLIPEDKLDTIPTPGEYYTYANVSSASSSKVTLYFTINTQEELNQLFTNMENKFIQKEYTKVIPNEGDEDEDKYQYTVSSITSDDSPLIISVERDWNQYTNIGKFYITFNY